MSKVKCNECGKKIDTLSIFAESTQAEDEKYYCNECFEKLALKEKKRLYFFSITSLILKLFSIIWLITAFGTVRIDSVESSGVIVLSPNTKLIYVTVAVCLWGFSVLVKNIEIIAKNTDK